MYSKGQIIDSTFQIDSLIGQGSHGDVYKGFLKSKPKEIIAIKIIDVLKNVKSKGKKDEKESIDAIVEMVKSEFQLLKSLNHENIVKVFDVGFDSDLKKLYYTMEFLDGESLFDFFKNNFNELNFLEVTYQALLGLSFLHDNKIIHYDIKPENLFICKCVHSRFKNKKKNNLDLQSKRDFTLKIFDFGLSEIKQNKSKELKSVKGTIEYMAPEVLITPDTVSYNSDLFSLAISLIQSITQEQIQIHNSSKNFLKNEIFLVQNYLNELYKKNIGNLSKIENKKIVEFLLTMLNENPIYRSQNSRSAIEKLNFIFNKKFPLVSACKQKSFLNNDTFIIREKKAEKLSSLYKYFFSVKKKPVTNKNIIFISGEKGSGKTKIIDNFYLSTSIKLNKIVKINSFDFDKRSLENILVKLEKKIENFILDIKNNKFNNCTYIFDNFESYSLTIKKFVFALLEKYRGNKKIFFVLAVENKSFTLENPFYLTYKTQKFYSYSKELKLKPLVKKDIPKIIEYFMGETQNFPQRFNDDLIFYSDGNFKKIMTFIDKFRSEKVVNRVANLVIFQDARKYNRILKADYKNKIKEKFERLKSSELDIVKTLFISYYPLSIDKIANILNLKDKLTVIKKRVNNLVKKEIITVTKSSNGKEYSTKIEDVQTHLLSYLRERETKKIIEDIYLSKECIDNNLNLYKIIKILLLEKKASNRNLKLLSASIRDLYSHYRKKLSTSRDIELFLLIISKVTNNIDLKLRIKIELVRYYKNSKQYTKINRHLNLIEKIIARKNKLLSNNLAEFILLKIRLFNSVRFNYDLKQFFSKNIEFLYKNINKSIFYELLIGLAFGLKESRKKVTFSLESLLKYLTTKLNDEDTNKVDVSTYRRTIYIFQLDAEFIKLDNDKFELLRKDIIYFKEKKKISNIFFKYFATFTSIAGLLKADIEEEINFAQNLAIKMKSYDELLKLLDSISNYYFKTDNFEKSLIYNDKKIEYLKKMKIPVKIPMYLDLMATKYMLTHPISEILSLFKNITTSEALTENTSTYLNFLYNRIFVTHQTGDFTEARKLYREYYLNSANLNLKKIVEDLFDDLVLIPELFDEEEFLEIPEELFKQKLLSKRDHRKIIKNIKEIYKFRIRTDFNPMDYDKVLNEPMSHMTPFMIIEYIKNNKALPSAKNIFNNTLPSYRNPSNLSNYTCFLTTQFFFLKNDELLEDIYDNLNKFYINGYYLKVIYFLLPILEFMIITRLDHKKENIKFLLLLNDIFKGIMQKMDKNLLNNFKQTYIYKRKQKIDKRFSF